MKSIFSSITAPVTPSRVAHETSAAPNDRANDTRASASPWLAWRSFQMRITQIAISDRKEAFFFKHVRPRHFPSLSLSISLGCALKFPKPSCGFFFLHLIFLSITVYLPSEKRASQLYYAIQAATSMRHGTYSTSLTFQLNLQLPFINGRAFKFVFLMLHFHAAVLARSPFE